jgi:hypothetical protein
LIAPSRTGELQDYSLSFKEGELNEEQRLWSLSCSCTVVMKKDGSGNIQKTVLPLRKMSKSTVKKWSFALLLLTNPLSYTIRRIISMGVVAIGGPLSLNL